MKLISVFLGFACFMSPSFQLEAFPGRWNCVMESVILGSRYLYLNVSTFYSLACFLPSILPFMFLRTGSYFVFRAIYTGLKLAVILLLLPPKLLGCTGVCYHTKSISL